MSFALPSKNRIDDFFNRLHALLFGVFHVLLLIFAMAALLVLAWSHIPSIHKKADESKFIGFALKAIKHE